MRRLLRGPTIAAALTVVVALAGCSYVTPPALEVSSKASSEPFYTLSRGELMDAVDAAGAATKAKKAGYTTSEIDEVLNRKMQLAVVKHFAEQVGAEVTEQDRQQAEQEMEQSGSSAQADPEVTEARAYVAALTRTLAKQRFDSGQADLNALIKQYYEQNLDQFRLPDQTCFHLIGIPAGEATATTPPTEADYAAALTQAAAVRQRIGPETFEAVADAESKVQRARKGGDVGCVPNTEIPPEVLTGIAALPAGQVSDPLRVEGGYFIIRLDSREAARQSTLDEAAPEIAPTILQQVGSSEIQSFLQRELDKLEVEVDPRFGVYRTTGEDRYVIVAPPGAEEPTVPTTTTPSAFEIPGAPPAAGGAGSPSNPVATP